MSSDILKLAERFFSQIDNDNISSELTNSIKRELSFAQSTNVLSQSCQNSLNVALQWAFAEIAKIHNNFDKIKPKHELTAIYSKPEYGIPDDFDAEFYLLNNRDLLNARVDPYFHYKSFGSKEGRSYRYRGPLGVPSKDGHGRLVRASDTHISGWAALNGEEIPSVTLTVNGIDIAQVKANNDIYLYPRAGGFGQPCGFVLPVHEQLRNLLPKINEVEARLDDGRPLTVTEDFCCQLSGNETLSPNLLKDRLDQGYIVSAKSGQVIFPIGAWPVDKKYRLLMDVAEAAETLHFNFQRSITIAYGTLLGAIRECDLLGHDDDVDIFILLDATDAFSAGKEFALLRNELAVSGCNVDSILDGGNFHWRFASGHSVDVFGLWSDGQTLNCYNACFPGSMKNVAPPRSAVLCGIEVPFPADSEQILAGIYGQNWRIPDKGFQWKVSEETKFRMREYNEGVRSVVVL